MVEERRKEWKAKERILFLRKLRKISFDSPYFAKNLGKFLVKERKKERKKERTKERKKERKKDS